MKDGRRMGEEVLRPTTRASDRAWRLPRLPIHALSEAAQRAAAPRANRDIAHGSCHLARVKLSGTTPRRQEACAISRFARGAAPLCASSLIC